MSLAGGDAPPQARSARLPLSLRALNVLGRGLGRVGLGPRPLSASSIEDAARRATGLDDFGESGWRDALHVLVPSFENEAQLSPFGRIAIKVLIRRALEARLGLVALAKREPSIAAERLPRPVFVVGFPRTGTTLLFNLLAQAEEARPLLGWEAYETLPPPGRRDRRIRKHRRAIRSLRRVRPELWELHPVEVEGPEECLPLLLRAVTTDAWLLYGRLPSYEAWLAQAPETAHDAAYRFHRLQLQVLQWQRPGGRWLLKSPAHLDALPSLLCAYPDACIVRTHRDLAKVLPSTCSLLGLIRSLFSDAVDETELGRYALDAARRRLDRMRSPLPETMRERILDVEYADLVADPLGTVARIHAHFDLPQDEGLRTRMEAWMAAHPRHEHGRHRYTLEQFGLAAEEVEALEAGLPPG